MIIAPPNQTEAAIMSYFSQPASRSDLDVEMYYIADFLGVWFKITKDASTTFPLQREMASPQLTRKLQEMGVCIGDQVLVAKEVTSPLDLKVRIVSPLTTANTHLIGRRFNAPRAEQQLLLTA